MWVYIFFVAIQLFMHILVCKYIICILTIKETSTYIHTLGDGNGEIHILHMFTYKKPARKTELG